MAASYGGIIGILLSKPQTSHAEGTNYLGIILTLAMAIILGLLNVLNRKLKNVHYTVVMYYHAMCGFCMAVLVIAIGYHISGSPLRIYTSRQYLLLFFCCCCDCLAMFANILSFQSDSSGFVIFYL